MIPAWLETHLRNTGRWNADGINRRVSATRCRTCGHRILTGLDDDICAHAARLDPTALSSLGELAAQLTGLATYQLRRDGNRIVIDRRDQFSIEGDPADTHTRPIHPEHQCGRSWAGALTKPTPDDTPATAYAGNTPPF